LAWGLHHQPRAAGQEPELSARKITWEELCKAVVREIDSARLRVLAAALDRELKRRKHSEHSRSTKKSEE